MRMKRLMLFSLLSLWYGVSMAQPPQVWDAANIKFHLNKLGVLGRVLYLAAHPDDENTMLIGYLSKGKMYETAYLSCTRGDGGQNLIGSEQGSELGLIRTEELLAARGIDGGKQFFSSANDFGFSKSAKETLKIWGHERILENIVWVIRQYQPDIIITRFPEDARAGHGHHWTSAILAHEAFKAAADPNRFKEQLDQVKPWQAKRLLWNTFNFGSHNTTAPDQFHITTGGYNALLGESYGQIAANSRSMHKSQGFGSAPYWGNRMEYFKTIEGEAPRTTLMDGIVTDWSRIKGGTEIGKRIAMVTQRFNMDNPGASVNDLLRIYKAINALPEGRWKREKLKETKTLILACAGLFADATTADEVVATGSHTPVQIRVMHRSDVPLQLIGYDLDGMHTAIGQALRQGEAYTTSKQLNVTTNEGISSPYWLRQQHPIGYYHIQDRDLIGRPMNPPAYTVSLQLMIAGTALSVDLPVQYRHTDDVQGELYQPLVIAPPVVVNVNDPIVLLSKEQPSKTVRVEIKSYKAQEKGTIHIELPDQFEVSQNDLAFQLDKAGDSKSMSFNIHLKPGLSASVSKEAKIYALVDGKRYNRGMEVITHSHIPKITLFPEAITKIVGLDISTTGKNIGYISGAGDKVPDALKQLGYQVTPILSTAISDKELMSFDAIITGIRAYNINTLLRPMQPRLLNYVKNGGVLVVQYNKNGTMVADPLGPYPFKVSADRVTEEDAAVKWLLPDNRAMKFPNQLQPEDFNGWIQERGLYFTTDADVHYKRLFEMHDTDSRPLDGSTLVCTYGKGKYVYSCLDFFRELPAGVPGAFRLFVNLLAKPADHHP